MSLEAVRLKKCEYVWQWQYKVQLICSTLHVRLDGFTFHHWARKETIKIETFTLACFLFPSLHACLCAGMVFESPSAFSIYIKRLVNPTRKADDGWKAVKYDGK